MDAGQSEYRADVLLEYCALACPSNSQTLPPDSLLPPRSPDTADLDRRRV